MLCKLRARSRGELRTRINCRLCGGRVYKVAGAEKFARGERESAFAHATKQTKAVTSGAISFSSETLFVPSRSRQNWLVIMKAQHTTAAAHRGVNRQC